MPRILKTVVPRIRRSLQERGLLVSLGRSVLLPIHLIQEFRKTKASSKDGVHCEFDLEHDVDTEGAINGWTYLSDLDIPSKNWIYGRNYIAIEPARFRHLLAGMNLRFEDFVFVDFGSGKGRALLMASEFPFKRVQGVEFSPELHAIAQQNIAKYAAHRRSGPVESVCMDFLDYPLPAEPSIFFLYDPCEDAVLVKLLRRIGESLQANPRTLYLIYVAPTDSKSILLNEVPWLRKWNENAKLNSCIYAST